MGQDQATVGIRPARPHDAAALVALYERHYGGHFHSTEDDWLEQAWPLRRVLVAGRGDAVVGGATDSPQAGWPHARRVNVLTTDEDAWRALHGQVLEHARTAGVQELFIVAQETFEPTCRLAAEAGYEPTWRTFGAHLDLADAGTLPDEPRELPPGFTARELTAQDVETAFALYTGFLADAPRTPATVVDALTSGQFTRFVADNHAFGVFDGGRCVALTMLKRTGDEAETEFTVTDPAVRGRGLAGHIKTLAVRALAAQGVTQFATGGAVVNTAVLRANQRLGYEIEPLWITFRLAVA